MNRHQRLKHHLSAPGFARVMAAHSPLSARLAQEAGFDGIWASGFELSALMGLPDASLITMTEHLTMTRAMAKHTDIPVVADIDTGFGNAVNVIHALREYEDAGASAVVIEDKFFPKMTSLIAGGRQELVSIPEFQGKIEAACDTRANKDFSVIARTEALIAGLGEEEALKRAAAYADAGADMILVHSKSRTPDEIESFVRAWSHDIPLVIVPTSYPEMDADRIRALGKIKMVIYGNHAIRSAVRGMKETFAAILEAGGTLPVEDRIDSVQEIFRLQDMDTLKANERRFLR